MTALEGAVREGKLTPGERLPTVRALAQDLRLSPVTVSAAYGALSRRGEPYRLESPPAIRVTTASLSVGPSERFADDLLAVRRPRRRLALA